MDALFLLWLSHGARWLAAAATLLAYAGLCGWVRRRWLAQLSGRPHLSGTAAGAAGPAGLHGPWVIYASQSGQAEAWARHTAQALHPGADGPPAVRLMTLDQLTRADLQDAQHHARQLLFIVSTTGDGEPPDNALDFVRRCMAGAPPSPDLSRLHYGLMALGDRDYGAYCGFGRRLDAWLRQAGAQPHFDRIEAHQADPAALRQWRHELARVSSWNADQAEPASAAFQPWRVTEKHCINPGSLGLPMVRLSLRPASGELPRWCAGDLAQILPPTGPGRARDYSIANLADDGVLQLLVRRRVLDTGQAGAVSGWLTGSLQVGDTVSLRVREHLGFRLELPAQVPLILMGNGSGLAGLRAHLQQRAQACAAAGGAAPERCAWLLFGERSRAHDTLLADDLAGWQISGVLSRLDRVFSRDDPEAPYVQHRLRQQAERLRDWLQHGAHLLICGSQAGMAAGVDTALRELLGDGEVDALMRSGRIRRDVY